MYFNFYYLFLLLRKYIKQKNMRLLLTFIIFILGGFYTFGDNNCCEQCCEYLGIFCNKGKGKENENNVEEKKEEEEVPEEFYLKKTKATDPEEIKKLVKLNWYEAKKGTASFILYEKIDGAGNQNINKKGVIKVKKYKNRFSIDKGFITEEYKTKKWALFEIIYKEKKEEEETKYLYCSDIESIAACGIFESCKQHISISAIACNTSGVTDMFFMFSDCSSLTKLDLFNFNIEKVTNMSCMFASCEKLKNLDLSKFDFKNVTDTSGMFSGIPDENLNSFTLPESLKKLISNK